MSNSNNFNKSNQWLISRMAETGLKEGWNFFKRQGGGDTNKPSKHAKFLFVPCIKAICLCLNCLCNLNDYFLVHFPNFQPLHTTFFRGQAPCNLGQWLRIFTGPKKILEQPLAGLHFRHCNRSPFHHLGYGMRQ